MQANYETAPCCWFQFLLGDRLSVTLAERTHLHHFTEVPNRCPIGQDKPGTDVDEGYTELHIKHEIFSSSVLFTA